MPAQVTVLANSESRPNGIVADEQFAYFISQGAPTTVRKLDLATWAVTTIVPDAGTAVRLVEDADHLYFKTGDAQNGRVVVVDKATGVSRNLATGSMMPGMVAIDDDTVYWGTEDTAQTVLHAIKKDGTGMRDIGSLPNAYLYELLADGSHVYATSDEGLLSFPKAGGAPVTLAPGSTVIAQRTNLAQDGSSIYWSDRRDNTIKKLPKTGGAPVTLASNEPDSGRLAVADDGTVYWTCRGSDDPGSTMLGALHKLPAGTSTVVEVASGLDHAIEPALLSHAVLWTVYGPLGPTTTTTGEVMAAPL